MTISSGGRRTARIAAAAAAIALLLSACGDDPPTVTQPEGTGGAPTTEESPTEDTPTDDEPTEDAPTEETPTEETPTEDAPTEDAPPDAGDRPSTEEIASGLRVVAESDAFVESSGGIELNDEFIDCWAEGIHDHADISNETAREVADGNADYIASPAEMQALTDPVMDCMDYLIP